MLAIKDKIEKIKGVIDSVQTISQSGVVRSGLSALLSRLPVRP